MQTLLIKKSDGTQSRWLVEEKNGVVFWNILRYDKKGYYLANHSFGGTCTPEDYQTNMEAIKGLGKQSDFTVESY